MDRFMHRQLGRRSVLRGAAAGAGALGVTISGAGRFTSSAWAQDATPAAGSFDASACYKPFGDAKTVQY